MKEIKFRAWRKISETMHEVTRVDFVGEYIYYNDSSMANTHYYSQEGCIKEFILMQYTGLKNHKGTEIYEGDIIHARGHYPGEGWYDTGEHEYNFKDEVKWDKEKLAYTCGDYYLHELDIVKIVGNKYENPEILEGRK